MKGLFIIFFCLLGLNLALITFGQDCRSDVESSQRYEQDAFLQTVVSFSYYVDIDEDDEPYHTCTNSSYCDSRSQTASRNANESPKTIRFGHQLLRLHFTNLSPPAA